MRMTAFAWSCLAIVCVVLGLGVVMLVKPDRAFMHMPVSSELVTAHTSLPTPRVGTSVSASAGASAGASAASATASLSIEPSSAPTDGPTVDASLARFDNDAGSKRREDPARLAAEIETQINQYYSLIKGMSPAMYVADHNTVLPLFFAGEPLRQLQDEASVQKQYTRYAAGNVIVKVDRLSPSGTVALIRIVKKNWRTETIDLTTGAVMHRDNSASDTTVNARAQWNADKRWRVVEILNGSLAFAVK